MDLSSLTPGAIVAQKQALTAETASVAVLRKVIDIQASEGAAMVQMMNQSLGVGTQLNTTA